MAEPGQIDIEGSRLRIAAIFLTSLAIVALCGGMLWFRPSSDTRSLPAGSLGELALIVGVGFFGLAAAVLAKRFFRAGPVVSVGPRAGSSTVACPTSGCPGTPSRASASRRCGANAGSP